MNTQNKFYKSDGTPISCTMCGCKDFTSKVIDTVGDGLVSETEETCNACGAVVTQWAYGSYNQNVAVDNLEAKIARSEKEFSAVLTQILDEVRALAEGLGLPHITAMIDAVKAVAAAKENT